MHWVSKECAGVVAVVSGAEKERALEQEPSVHTNRMVENHELEDECLENRIEPVVDSDAAVHRSTVTTAEKKHSYWNACFDTVLVGPVGVVEALDAVAVPQGVARAPP